MNELNNFDLLTEMVADHQAELRREAQRSLAGGTPRVMQVLVLVLGSAALLALLVTLGIVLA